MTLDGRTEWFLDNLWRLYNRHCHKKTKTLSRKRLVKPWVTTNLRSMANFKHHLFKRYKTNQVPFHIYNEYKNNLSARFKRAKKEYYRNKFQRCHQEIKETWNNINSILAKHKIKIRYLLLKWTVNG